MSNIAIGGIVLCGGESRRMGRDKASLPFGPETLLERVVRQVGGVASPVAVVASPDQVLPPLSVDAIVVRDPVAGRGPWQGISAGLRALAGNADAAFVRGCDTPFLAAGWLPRLADLLDDHVCAVCVADGRLQPLAALYRLEALDTIDRLLADDRARPLQLFDLVPTVRIDADRMRDVDPTLESLRNVNTPEEVFVARKILDLLDEPPSDGPP